MRVYIAGPMRGYPHLNFPAFDEAAAYLREIGYTPVSPAEMDRELFGWPALPDPETVLDGFDLEEAMRRDLAAIDTCDEIVMLPGWESSEGAKREFAHAVGRGMYVYAYSNTGRGFSRLSKIDYVTRADVRRTLEQRIKAAPETATQFAAGHYDHVRVPVPVNKGMRHRTAEQNEILGTFLDLLAGPTGDGAGKRSAGLKPSWKIDGSHKAAAFRHVDRWRDGEQFDADSGCHPLVHAAWRLLAVAYQELAARGDLPEGPKPE